MTRAIWVRIHRWVGLAMAVVLLVAGLTGALLAWYAELDGFFAPNLRDPATHAPTARPLDPFSLREAARAGRPEADLNFVELRPLDSLAPVRFRVEGVVDPVTKQRAELPYSEFYVDPVSGRVVGERRYGDISQGLVNAMPFVLELHTSLALGTVGHYAFGIVALLWTIDCFVGAYLTFPARASRRNGRHDAAAAPGWWQRWRRAWRVRWDSGSFKLNFDLHRAGGLWTWVLLFVFAWSSVYFNLTDVYQPVMRALFGMRGEAVSVDLVPPATAAPFQAEPGLAWRDAHAVARQRMAETLARLSMTPLQETVLSYDPEAIAFSYAVTSVPAAMPDAAGRELSITFDANTGVLRSSTLQPPARLGDVITDWLGALHIAAIWGLPYRIVVCLTGLAVAMLSVTGVVVWWKKRAARNGRRARAGVTAGA